MMVPGIVDGGIEKVVPLRSIALVFLFGLRKLTIKGLEHCRQTQVQAVSRIAQMCPEEIGACVATAPHLEESAVVTIGLQRADVLTIQRGIHFTVRGKGSELPRSPLQGGSGTRAVVALACASMRLDGGRGFPQPL